MKQRQSLFILVFFVFMAILLAIPGVFELFKPGYYSSHDGEGHVIRMDEFYHAFKDGQIPSRWSKRLYFGYGYPFTNFNYPAIYYFGVPIMAAGFTAETAMKIETISIYLASSAIMFLYLRRKIRWQYALLGSVLYIYAPYRLLNIYVRGSVAESAAFLFPPLILWAAELLAQRKSKAIPISALVIGFLGISHNISALLLFGFFFVYLVFLSLSHKSPRTLITGTIAFILGLAIAAFFLVPALGEKKLTFLDDTIAKDYPDHFVYPIQLIREGWGFGGSTAGPNDGLSFNIGLVGLGVSIAGTIWLIILHKKHVFKWIYQADYSMLMGFCYTILIGSIFFMFSPSKIFWDHLPLLPFVQFPWRFLLLTVPVLAILAPLTLNELTNIYHWKLPVQMFITTALITVILFIAKDEWHINQILIPSTISGDALEGTTTWADEQATRWFKPKPTKIPTDKIEFLDPQAKYSIKQWTTAKHEYSVLLSRTGLVTENTMYYPGWTVKVDGKPVHIDYLSATHSGLLNFIVDSGSHSVISTFGETKERLRVDLLSFLTAMFTIGWLVIPSNLTQRTLKSKKQNKK